MKEIEVIELLLKALKNYASATTARTQRQAHIDAMEAIKLAESYLTREG